MTAKGSCGRSAAQADIVCRTGHVRKMPNSEVAPLFNRVVDRLDLRPAVPSLRSIRLRTELTIARRTNAVFEWAFRRLNVWRLEPRAATLSPMRGRRFARVSQLPRCPLFLPADSEGQPF